MNKEKMIPFEKVLEKDMQDPEFVQLYEADREEYELCFELIRARKAANLTHKEIADRMNTSQSQVVKLESGKGTISSLRKYAKVTGKRVKITLI
ncbi:MAG: helix-turn-helix domain-containing protein [Synergistaceae bacterium]|nr:helix-turn-helix domain-containing protein [Synergistaceae bacterium]